MARIAAILVILTLLGTLIVACAKKSEAPPPDAGPGKLTQKCGEAMKGCGENGKSQGGPGGCKAGGAPAKKGCGGM